MDTPVTGAPRSLLRLEGLLVLIGAVTAYHLIQGSWLWFALLILAPDLSMLGYVLGAKTGAMVYNAVHTYVGPGLVAAGAAAFDSPGIWSLCIVWVAHIGMDRAAGYGLKYPSGFHHTHLGVGRGDRSRVN